MERGGRGEKEGKEGIGVFPRCSQTDTAFFVKQGNLERAMPMRHHDMQGKLGNISPGNAAKKTDILVGLHCCGAMGGESMNTQKPFYDLKRGKKGLK